MSTPIKDGHILDPKDRVITLGKDLSGSAKRTIVIDKKGGSYVLTITTLSSKTSDDYDLVSKIPPDTGARLKAAKKTKVQKVNKIK